ncbi:cell shape-determining protein MreC [mine drainage metagenome]|uniref:Cell shape-determining protein MreC n=1 Tax=mine drainage metagenome TaxID=410659 RepID=A0A1J5PDZ1_9ZZZZ
MQSQLEAQWRLENNRLRGLLQLQQSLPPKSVAAQISAQASDPFSRTVVIDRGRLQGVELGSPVIDETGLLGQVTRDYPWSAEVTLITDRDAVVLGGSTDNEFCKLAWRREHKDLHHLPIWQFADSKGSLRLEWLRRLGISGVPGSQNGLRFHTQLFTGYGDSLVDYNRHRTVLSIGLSLVDW